MGVVNIPEHLLSEPTWRQQGGLIALIGRATLTVYLSDVFFTTTLSAPHTSPAGVSRKSGC